MIRNYFKIALRNIKRYPAHSILNIIGMAIGMACAILLLLWARSEASYDRFHKNADNLFRVTSTDIYGGKIRHQATTPFPLAAALKEEYPEIIRSTRYHNFSNTFIKDENNITGKLALVDKDFFMMFDIEFVRGNKNSALTGPNDAVITEEMAKRYFGDEDPLGKTIAVNKPKNILTVTAVIKNIPRNSNFYSDCLASYEFYYIVTGGYPHGNIYTDWNPVYNYTMIELMNGTNSQWVEEKIKDFIQRKKNGSTTEIFLQNIKKIHLNSQKYEGDIASGNVQHVRLASLLAILILAIACINFMNILTAQSSGRAKEIGIRKMAGAGKPKIIVQFLGETLLIVFIAHIIAMILVELLLPGFSNLMRARLEVNYLSSGLYLGLFVVIIFCGLLAGSYPAFYLSSLKPLATIRGMIDGNPGKARFRKALVISQFALSFVFIICTIIVRKQIDYLADIDLGQNINNIGYFDIPEGVRRETLKKELGNIPNVLAVTITGDQNVLNNHSMVYGVNWRGKKEGTDVIYSVLNTDMDYAKTFQIELKEGSFLSTNEFSTDTTTLVINEKAAEIMGFENPIGEVVSDQNGNQFRIGGVVKNFHFKALHSAIEPLIIAPIPPLGGKCYVKMNPDHIPSIVSSVESVLKTLNPDYSLDLKLVKDDFNNMFLVEQIASTVLGFMTVLAIIISCLGLIGLSTYMTLRRTKEIGIRKANGAKTGEIFSFLTSEYLKLVLISLVIASPVAWYATNIWLRSYVYRTNVGWWVFVLAWIIVMVITILTVGFQTYRAANKNPVEALRYE
ncbi:MAG: ABC transporter permease [Bacteroidales bacterium]|nr:ABC transporter permease [Bacteroidales bacterium]